MDKVYLDIIGMLTIQRIIFYINYFFGQDPTIRNIILSFFKIRKFLALYLGLGVLIRYFMGKKELLHLIPGVPVKKSVKIINGILYIFLVSSVSSYFNSISQHFAQVWLSYLNIPFKVGSFFLIWIIPFSMVAFLAIITSCFNCNWISKKSHSILNPDKTSLRILWWQIIISLSNKLINIHTISSFSMFFMKSSLFLCLSVCLLLFYFFILKHWKKQNNFFWL